MNRLSARVGDAGDVQVLGGRVPLNNPDAHTPGSAVEALLRPEALAGLRVQADSVTVAAPRAA
jgi:hypothetical protein